MTKKPGQEKERETVCRDARPAYSPVMLTGWKARARRGAGAEGGSGLSADRLAFLLTAFKDRPSYTYRAIPGRDADGPTFVHLLIPESGEEVVVFRLGYPLEPLGAFLKIPMLKPYPRPIKP